MKTLTTGSDFSGVGAFDYAIERVAREKGFKHERVYACDWDKFARQSYIAAHGEPDYYPKDVYEREIPSESLDIYMTSPPCQAFSLAGKRKGENDERGVLFYNSHEFIQKNKPRFFIFENVKGLLSDDKGRTFQRWIDFLAGKSVNGNSVIFPREESVPYHVYYRVLNSKKYGVPQNRERVFIVGIRDDEDNNFRWPKEEYLEKRLKDILETEVDEKFFLSDEVVRKLIDKDEKTDHLDPNMKDVSNALRCGGGSVSAKHSFDTIKIVGNVNPSGNGMNGNVFDERGLSPTLSTNKGEGIKVKQINPSLESGGKQPYQQNRIYDIEGMLPALNSELNGRNNICVPVLTPDRLNKRQNGRRFKENDDPSFTITTQDRHGIYDGFKIRRLTPLECFRLQDFPDEHVQKCKEAKVSDSQLYKQAGNSITVKVLELILNKLSL